jgi:hypothetical protein
VQFSSAQAVMQSDRGARSGAVLRLTGLIGLAWAGVSCSTAFSAFRKPAGEPAKGLERRQLISGLGLAAALPATPAMAYETYKDSNLGFEFKYPTGLQKYDSDKYNYFLRDIIEPLESIGVKVQDTNRKSLDEVGDAMTVAQKLLEDTTPAKAPREIISAVSKKDGQGRRFDVIEYRYQWKFDKGLAQQLGRTRYQLHNKALVYIVRKKQYTVLATCEEDRYPVQGDQLGLGVDTFKLLF